MTKTLGEGLVIIVAYMMLLLVVEGKHLKWQNAAKFYALFVGLSLLFRWLDIELQDQLTRVAGFQLGTKLFFALAA